MLDRTRLSINMNPIGILQNDVIVFSGDIHFYGLSKNEIIYHLEQFVSTLDSDAVDMSIHLVSPTPDNFKQEFPSRVNSGNESNLQNC